jgi:site-specific DNA-cytosine methylase
VKVLDLFAGLRGWSDPFAERGHDVVTLDLDARFESDITADILEWGASELDGWRPDIILASPPCEAFSVLSIGRNWTGPDDVPAHQPKTDAARLARRIVERTREIIHQLEPAFYVIENPRGKLRKLPVVADLERRTVTYCQYGAPWQKPTDLWGGFPPTLQLRPMCPPNADCHVPAPRGSRTGIQSDTSFERKDPRVKGYFRGGIIEDLRATSSKSEQRRIMVAARAKIPEQLAVEVCRAAERDLAEGLVAEPFVGRLFA